MNFNEDLIHNRCQEVTDSVHRLERIAGHPKDEFLSDADLQDIACYRLLVAIEGVLAVGFHVVARGYDKVPEEYPECFAILSEHGVIEEGLSGRLQELAEFRNLLIHRHNEVDHGRIYELLHERMGDLTGFCSGIVKQLEEEQAGETA